MLKKIIPHICIVLSIMFGVFIVLDGFNPAMAFLTSDLSKAVFWLLIFFTLVLAILYIKKQRED